MRRSFDHVARPYAAFERVVFGRALERARFQHLARLADARRVLVLGEGDGRCLERLLSLAPHLEVDVVEQSANMIARTRARIGECGNVRFLQADAQTIPFPARYDAVLTCFFLDCFEESAQRRLIARIRERLNEGALWVYADFVSGEGRWQRFRNGAWVRFLYLAFSALTDIQARRLCDPRPLLREHGLELLESQGFARGLLTSEVWRARAGSSFRDDTGS